MFEIIKQPWPWYIAGPLIGLSIPLLLIIGNKALGISSVFRHICAACAPGDIEFLKYDLRVHLWNIAFVIGILIGGFIVAEYITHPAQLDISPKTITQLSELGVDDLQGFMPDDIFNWKSLFSLKGFLLIVAGGFLVGFGTRYAGGCTSGHAIMGLSNLQWPSLLAVVGFFIGGLVMTYFILPYILIL